MVRAARFTARVEAGSGGGHHVVVPVATALAAGLAHRARVRGTVDGVAYRSAIVKHADVFYLGVHKATLVKAQKKAGARVAIEIEIDREPLVEDTLPEPLAAALARDRPARAAWEMLAPSHKREHVRYINDAKKLETRQARVKKTIMMLKRR